MPGRPLGFDPTQEPLVGEESFSRPVPRPSGGGECYKLHWTTNAEACPGDRNYLTASFTVILKGSREEDIWWTSPTSCCLFCAADVDPCSIDLDD